MPAINNVNNYPKTPHGNHVSSESKKLDDIIRKKKVEDKDVPAQLPDILTGSTVLQHSLLRLSLAFSGYGAKESSDKAVTSDALVSDKVMTNRPVAVETPDAGAGLSPKSDKPAESKLSAEIKGAVDGQNLAKNSQLESGVSITGVRTSVTVRDVAITKDGQMINNKPTFESVVNSKPAIEQVVNNKQVIEPGVTSKPSVEQELQDSADKPLTTRNDVTIMQPQTAYQGIRHAEVKENAVMTKDSQQMLLGNSDGVAADRVSAKASANVSNLTYNFSEWGNGHRVNVQLTAQHGMPLVLNPSDNLVQERLADQGRQDERGQPLWVFQDEQEQQQSRDHKSPKYTEDQK